MITEVFNLLAEIRRSGGDVRLVDSDRLKLIAPTTLMPELVERVRAAKPMLLAALTDIGRIASTAPEGGGGVSTPRRNSATVQHLPAGSSSGRVIPTPAVDWRTRYREALAHWSALHSAEEALRLTWGKIESHWHMQHGERTPHWQCAGCGEPIGGLTALTLGDGNRVHFDTFDCLITFGERWRNEAVAALKALGLEPPVESDP
jgi:hypothetical protein